LYHFDVYRLAAPEDLEGLGYEDFFYGDGVCVVEWSGLTAAYLPGRRIGIRMERAGRSGGKHKIAITLIGGGDEWRQAAWRYLGGWREHAGTRD
jgi:tRNA threonylcarbamoyladenosine biosynthesis protein TsaE